ncbi:MerR family transcriptional regulator [uncultured Desulfosarcina sp.]|uniref:MerR family transcriptional regulator n=1 Tax=uncultured Desulfosarcina sp. TaxID=218289 RepID=UPI0029C975CC|nr:MerR family transcriptional regulator [uncultured Desulfosarcina sp.]
MQEDAHGVPRIPDKFYFRIGEVSEIVDVPPYVLRFWETEFKQIKPKRTRAGQRMYRRQDVELVLRIKHLLYDRKFTIEGARQHLKRKTGSAKGTPTAKKSPAISEIREELIRIRQMIDASSR